MNKKHISSLFLGTLLFTAACNSSTTENIKNEADTIAEKVDNVVDTMKANIAENREENFVKDVVKANAQELHLLALAQTKSASKSIKSAAKHMEADHKKMGETMMDYATKKNIDAKVEDSDISHDFDDKTAGADWDRDWVDKMVDEHEKMVKKFENESTDAKDADLKAIVDGALPTLRMHLDMAKEMQAKMDAAK